jgi:uncharacterized phage protein gp47/JayE
MAYTAPRMDESGLVLSSYTDIRDDLINTIKSIFGQDIYIDVDSQDYQQISAFALKIYDNQQAIQLAYNNRSPSTAIGAGLAALVKVNGITKKSATYSTCDVTLTGTPNTVIASGVVSDTSGYKWDLPTTVTIGTSGTVTVTATCQTIGAIEAAAGTLINIDTPTKGWTSVTNSTAAAPGTAVETDSALRERQALSVANPSQTLLVGTYGAIAALDGVTRVKLYENDTNVTDSDGLASHSIAAVVEGGAIADIAKAIWLKKGIGCYTNGDIATTIIDDYGYETTIRFYRPTDVPIFVTVNLKKLSGYVTTMADSIDVAIVNYLNSLDIGDDLTISALWAVALNTLSNLTNPAFSITSITAGTSAGSQGTDDITIAFNQTASGSSGNITINTT